MAVSSAGRKTQTAFYISPHDINPLGLHSITFSAWISTNPSRGWLLWQRRSRTSRGCGARDVRPDAPAVGTPVRLDSPACHEFDFGKVVRVARREPEEEVEKRRIGCPETASNVSAFTFVGCSQRPAGSKRPPGLVPPTCSFLGIGRDGGVPEIQLVLGRNRMRWNRPRASIPVAPVGRWRLACGTPVKPDDGGGGGN